MKLSLNSISTNKSFKYKIDELLKNKHDANMVKDNLE